ncbi:MAG: Smr/MutS family protein [Flavobacteriia bacterium]|jgi:DNA-nicking Smr family endonuclease|nr:Smr/MutS family protein [Flavobacteriia bacterium]
MGFEIGQRVGYLYEKGYGTINSINGQQAMVEDEDGFERTFLLNELVFIHSERYDKNLSIEKDVVEQEVSYRILQEKTGQRKPLTVWEVDLHIEEILESHQGMSNTEIMLKQVAEFRSMFKKAKREGIHKLIVIHGVGEGVLKNEIRTYLSQQDQIEVYDADFSEYGKGATAVEFHPNWIS